MDAEEPKQGLKIASQNDSQNRKTAEGRTQPRAAALHLCAPAVTERPLALCRLFDVIDHDKLQGRRLWFQR